MLIERPKTVVSQLGAILRERIRSHHYPAGSRLPSESDLVAEFSVSRASVRTVLAALAAEGLILRRQGDGTYVNPRIREVNTHLGGLWDFSTLIENSGYEVSIVTVSVAERPATAAESQDLDIAEQAPVLAMVRVFEAGGSLVRPRDRRGVILAHNVLPRDRLRAAGQPYEADVPLHEFLRRYEGPEIGYVIYDIHAAKPDAHVRDLLQRRERAPLLHLSGVFYDQHNTPVAIGRSYFDDSRLNLRLVQPWG